MVNIGPQFGNLDPLNDRRRLERNGKVSINNPSNSPDKAASANNATGAEATQQAQKSQQTQQAQNTAASNSDQRINSNAGNAADIQRYVDVLKNMDPSDLHRVDELRQNIESGNYDSSLDELIDPLLNFLSDASGNEPA